MSDGSLRAGGQGWGVGGQVSVVLGLRKMTGAVSVEPPGPLEPPRPAWSCGGAAAEPVPAGGLVAVEGRADLQAFVGGEFRVEKLSPSHLWLC